VLIWLKNRRFKSCAFTAQKRSNDCGRRYRKEEYLMEIRHEQPYQKIQDACRTTGLSQFFLRKGCRDGTIPCIRSGRTYYIDIPALLEKLGTENQQKEGKQ